MAVLFVLLLLLSFVSPVVSQTSLTFNERISAQEKIDRVYYNHRIWPNPSPKPPFEQMVLRSVIEKKVNDSLNVQISAAMLQTEMNRIAKTTKDPVMLQELFSALNNDLNLIAETLVRPILAQRMINGESFVSSKRKIKKLRLPEIAGSSCEGWEVLDASNPPSPRAGHTAIWTGTEMIIWGGHQLNTGGRYDPALNTWTPTSTGTDVPSPRSGHTAVWTGTEMIIWGGFDTTLNEFNTGGRYDPVTDTWLPTSVGTNVPEARSHHTAVWTGNEMIVWGGQTDAITQFNSGGRYDPSTDSWQPTSIGMNVPEKRGDHTAVWTGQEMVIWGGVEYEYAISSGARYNPVSDSWLPTSLENVPHSRWNHTAVWTGNEMIIWGGVYFFGEAALNTGASYDPIADTWQATTTVGAPFYRTDHTAIWTGNEMIIWGGTTGFDFGSLYTKTGARYSFANDTWVGTAIGPNAPSKRSSHSAIWTGSKMIIFGGFCEQNDCAPYVDTGGIYSPDTNNIILDPPDLPKGEIDTPYFQTLSASGGTPPYTFTLAERDLPEGLTLDASTGVISGTPTDIQRPPFFAVSATDANSCVGSKDYSIILCPVINFDPPTLPTGKLGVFYNQTITVPGTDGIFLLTAGTLPDGLSLEVTTGVISGTPTKAGIFNFTITFQYSASCKKSHDYSIKVIGPTTHN